jgi:FdhD protein
VHLPGGEEADDRVAVEEPLELRIGGRPVAVTMRTPGHDEELALGFALSEGLRPVSARVPDDLAANTIELEAPDFDPQRIARSFYTTSSCGVCGKGALEAIAVEAPPVESTLTISGALVSALPDRLREAQAAFASTGGLHATGLFTAAGQLVSAREDVGRHNAMDKVIGRAFLEGLLPLADHVLCVSGRLSFELVQKAAVAGCPVVVAVGAPSSLAVELAVDRGVTLCGFVRDGRCNVYSRPERIIGS